MNLSLGAIFTVEAIFAYVIWRKELAEELRAIRPTHGRALHLICDRPTHGQIERPE
jgi:hypothetical protein